MTELIPDPEFKNPDKWILAAGVGSITIAGEVLTYTNAVGTAIPTPQASAVVGELYDYEVIVNSFTNGLIAVTFAGNILWTGAFGAGTFQGRITATDTEGLVIGGAFGANVEIKKVSVMTATLVNDILDYLHGQGILDGVTSWVGKANYLPPQPDQTVVITETPGLPPDGSPGDKWDQPAFQVRVRGANDGMEAAQTKVFEIFDALNDVTIPGYCFIFGSTSAPLFIGLDTNNRPEFVWNFETMKQR